MSCRQELSRSSSGVVAKMYILRSNVLGRPSLVAVCAGVKHIRVQCFARERHSECTVAGQKVVSTCRCVSKLPAIGLVCAAVRLEHYGYAWEVVAVPGRLPLHVGIAGHCTGRSGNRRMGFPNQAAHRSFAVLGVGVGS